MTKFYMACVHVTFIHISVLTGPYAIGLQYAHGIGVEQNEKQAVACFMASARKGEVDGTICPPNSACS